MKKKYGDRARLLFTDTDSLIYEVERADIYADMVNSREMYDLSNYPATHPKYNADFVRNRAKVGPMPDEASCSIITDYVGLRPKMYLFVIAQSKEDGTVETVNKHRAKGIQRAVADKYIQQQYKEYLEQPEENYVSHPLEGSRFHRIYAIEVLIPPVSNLILSAFELSLS